MTVEEQRYQMQCSIDASKTLRQRNSMGQYSTPFELACDIVSSVLQFFPNRKSLRAIEPACGTGVFFSALENALGEGNIRGSLGFEIDPTYQRPAAMLWREQGIDIRCANFLHQRPDRLFPLLIANPPYTRHHYIKTEEKTFLQSAVKTQTGLSISGLAGLYCYFIMISTSWLEEGGLSCWLVPSEFMDVNYGEAVKQFLLEKVDLLRIHRFDENDLQFKDALVTSSVVFFKNQPPSDRPVEFTYSGNVSSPAKKRMVSRQELTSTKKWNHLFYNKEVNSSGIREMLGDFFDVRRGIATGCNEFFIIDAETARNFAFPKEYLTPILPSPRRLTSDWITSNEGIPLIGSPLFLFSTNDDLMTIKEKWPKVAEYIDKGVENGINDSYICNHHIPWYSCEKRMPAPFVVPYMGRKGKGHKMFRFILNESDAVATNAYLLLYPKKEYAYLLKNRQLLLKVWEQLNKIPTESFGENGRFYGGGLHKMEPRELLTLPAEGIAELLGNRIYSLDFISANTAS